jgi:hypothetical protein
MYGSNYTYNDGSKMIWASGSDSIKDLDDVECWVLVEDESFRVCVGEFNVTNRHDRNALGTEIRYSTQSGEWDVAELGYGGFKVSSSSTH